MQRFRKTIAGAVATLVATLGLLLGTASVASAQTTPLGDITASVTCGPLSTSVTTTVTNGMADTAYTTAVNVAGMSVSTSFTTNASGSGVGSLPTLPLVGQLIPVDVTAAGQSATVYASCS